MIRRGFPHTAEAFDDALAGRAAGPLDAETRELVATAELLCRSAVAEPSPGFTTALRDRLMHEAADVLVAEKAEPTPVAVAPRRRRRLAGLTAAVVAGVGTVGLVSTSATAVPGDVLYPIKRTIEDVQVSLHRDAQDRGEYRLQQARERLAEVVQLQTGDTTRIAPTLDAFTEQARAGSNELFEQYRATSSATAVDAVNDFVASASIDLAEMADTMPADGVEGWTQASDAVTALADTASTICQTCATADVSSLTDLVQSLATGGTVVPDATAPADESSEKPARSTTPEQPVDVPSVAVPTIKAPNVPTGGGSTPDVVKDTVDGLLGEDGLVPGLVGGLLGQQPK